MEEAGELVTHQYVAASGRSGDGAVEQHATWVIHWKRSPDSDQLLVRSIDVVDFEQTTLRGTDRLFADATPAVLGQNACYSAQLLHGMNYWLDRTQDMRYFSPLGNPGLAIGDVNGDGLDDLYICQEANLPNRLFLQQPDGTARDVAAAWDVDWLDGSRSVLLVDLDNDGDQDLVVTILGGVVIASNEGDRFRVRDVLTTHDDTTSIVAADYDLDGDLDLYVCVDYPNDFFASASEVPVQGGAANRVYHDANNAGRNTLFRNDIRQAASPVGRATSPSSAVDGVTSSAVDASPSSALRAPSPGGEKGGDDPLLPAGEKGGDDPLAGGPDEGRHQICKSPRPARRERRRHGP